MGIFGNIMDKIFHHQSAAPQPAPAEAAPDAAAPEAAAPEPAAAPQNVDVGAVLSEMASMKDDGGGNYQTSIVDLLKLLDLDSSLSARKELADELGVSGEDGSAEKNIALHQAVMAKLAENGGVVPDSLRN
ncbi:MAG: DUF3597 family protein [Pseudomonadota bacterium]|jgi:3-oxoacyl-ACP reductase-like protein